MRKSLVSVLVAAFIVAGLASYAMAVSPVGHPTQLGSLLIFPKIDTRVDRDPFFPTPNITFNRDAIITIANAGPDDIWVHCKWSYPKIASVLKYDTFHVGPSCQPSSGSGHLYREFEQQCCGQESFGIHLTPQQVKYFSAGTGLGNILNPGLFEAVSKIPDAANGIAALYCWVTKSNSNLTPISYNFLYGEVVNIRWELTSGEVTSNGLSAWQYNGYSFRANAPKGTVMGKADPTSDAIELKLTGKKGEYDACPDVLTFNFLARQSLPGSYDLTNMGTDLSMVPCSANFRNYPEGANSPIKTNAVFYLYNADEKPFDNVRACVKCFFEQILGVYWKGRDYLDPTDCSGWIADPYNDGIPIGYQRHRANIIDAFQFVNGYKFMFMSPWGGLGTLYGRATVDTRPEACNVGSADAGVPTVDVPLLAVAYDFFDIIADVDCVSDGLGGCVTDVSLGADGVPEMSSGRNVVGKGKQAASIFYTAR